MKKTWASLLLMAMILGGPGYALAQGEETEWGEGAWPEMMGMMPGRMGMGRGMMGMGSGMMGMMGMMHGMMGPALGVTLTEEQEKKVTDLRARFLQDRAKAQAELIQARAALQALVIDPSAKDEAIEAQAQRVGAAQGRLILLRVKMARQMQGVLTKEQKEEMMRRFQRQEGMMGPGQREMRPGGMMPEGRMPGR